MASANPQEERQETKHNSTLIGGRGNQGRPFYRSGENQESSQPRHKNYNNTDFIGSGRGSVERDCLNAIRYLNYWYFHLKYWTNTGCLSASATVSSRKKSKSLCLLPRMFYDGFQHHKLWILWITLRRKMLAVRFHC
jgi:hypothetical protein